MKRWKRRIWISITSAVILFCLSLPNIFYNNHGVSKSVGTPARGRIVNSYKIPYRGTNFRYFSPISYYLLGNCYVHSDLYKTLLDAFEECCETCPGVYFRIMECSRKRGGKTIVHHTHQNGLSVDLMVPLIKDSHQITFWDHFGLLHYLLGFDSKGRLEPNKKISIDFETMGKEILAIDNAARKNGLRISKVIFKLDLKDDFFQTVSGREVKRRGIYFAAHLSTSLSNLHDDHFHVDFEAE
jgi:penicillin-insensitive murein DD-endopeptidase